jgi:ribonuclease HI
VVGNPAPRWIKPPRRFAKVNVDVAISKNSSKASAAAVARGEDGNFLGASHIGPGGLRRPENTEVVACCEGLALAGDLGLQTLRVASDCVNAVRSITVRVLRDTGPSSWKARPRGKAS